MKVRITCGFNDTDRRIFFDNYINYNEFIPRVGDTIIWNNLYYDVRNVVIDYSNNEIRVWVKDSINFK